MHEFTVLVRAGFLTFVFVFAIFAVLAREHSRLKSRVAELESVILKGLTPFDHSTATKST